jgi:hypothetical protein
MRRWSTPGRWRGNDGPSESRRESRSGRARASRHGQVCRDLDLRLILLGENLMRFDGAKEPVGVSVLELSGSIGRRQSGVDRLHGPGQVLQLHLCYSLNGMRILANILSG